MILNFLFNYFNIIVLAVWGIFFILVVLRTLRVEFIKNVSYRWFLATAVLIHLLYGASATVLQYFAFGKSEIGKLLLTVPLPSEVPLPTIIDFVRPLFSGSHGYFALYSFQRFFLGTVALFAITTLFVLFFSVYGKYRPTLFKEGDIAVIALAFLVSGYLGSIVLVPLALTAAFVIGLLNLTFKKVGSVDLAMIFLAMSPFALIFSIPLLSFVSLYPLLKI